MLRSIGNDLFNEVEKLCGKNEGLTDDALLALHSLYGSPFQRALELLEQDCVTFLRSNDGMSSIIQVQGSSGLIYTLFPSVNFCSCPAYLYNVIGTRTELTCKHVLTAKVTEVLSRGKEIKITSKELYKILCKAAKLGESDSKCA